MNAIIKPLFAAAADSDSIWAAFQLALCFVGYVSFFVVPLGALAAFVHLCLSLPLRRRERARMLLDMLDTALTQGTPVEQTLIAAAASRDATLGVRFHLLAAHLENGLRLETALERVPRLLPPPVAAMLRVGARLGDLRRVLPTCREWVRERPAGLQSAYHYTVHDRAAAGVLAHRGVFADRSDGLRGAKV